MTNQATLDKLTQLRLTGMKNAFTTYLESSSDYTNDELIGYLTESEWLHRQQMRIQRLRKNAKFRYTVQIADLDFEQNPGLDKNLLLRLSDASFIQKKENVIITGPTGVGKSFIASALGHQACMMGYKTMYFNTRKLFHLLNAGMADGAYMKMIAKLEKLDLLILDDFGLNPMDGQARQALMEIVEDRHGKSSIIITSQLPVDKWHDLIGSSAIADAVLDRVVHSAHRLELKGESRRRKKKTNTKI